MKGSNLILVLVLTGFTHHLMILQDPKTKKVTTAYRRQLKDLKRKEAIQSRIRRLNKAKLQKKHPQRRLVSRQSNHHSFQQQKLNHSPFPHRSPRHFKPHPRFLKQKSGKSRKLKHKKARKTLLMPWFTAKEKKYEQYQRFGEIKRKMLADQINEYLTDEQVNRMNSDSLQSLHEIYLNDVQNIEKAKTLLIEQMDDIYNNFINPGRWFY